MRSMDVPVPFRLQRDQSRESNSNTVNVDNFTFCSQNKEIMDLLGVTK